MSKPDAFSELEEFYKDLTPKSIGGEMLRRIHSRRQERLQKITGAVAGIGLGTAVAITAVFLASRPSHSAQDGTMASIAKVQMIHSGLALRSSGKGEVPH